jgi:uncharacterized protein DUF1566
MIVPRAFWSVVALALVLTLTPVAVQTQQEQEGGLPALQNRVRALEAGVADLGIALNELKGARLTSYDQLAGLPCTTAANTDGIVHLIGLFKKAVCAAGSSANGRFLDFGLVIFDTKTNLLWEKKTTAVGSGEDLGGDLHDVDNRYSWCVAIGNSVGICAGNVFNPSWIGRMNAEGFAGFSDWRVPNATELFDIVDSSVTACGSGGPCIDPIFGPTQASQYWASGEFRGGYANFLDFLVGIARPAGPKTDAYYVRAVRPSP